MLRVNGLRAGYGKAEALHGVSLHVDTGEIVAILGPNGAGKSTLVNTIAGVLRLWGGSINLDGVELTTVQPHEVITHGVALVPEGRRIFPKMTVAENLDLGAYVPVARSGHAEALASVYKIFPRLRERESQLAGTLSGGEQQMVAIGRALMARPRLLLLDEPSLGLAPIVVENIFEVLRQVNATGVSVLLVEQNAVEALDVADRGYILEDGQVVGEGPAKDWQQDERLHRAYLGL